MSHALANLKPLNNQQYAHCVERAAARITASLGTKPRRADFERDLAPLWQPMDWLLVVIFLAAAAISSLHIADAAASAAAASYQLHKAVSLRVGEDVFTLTHQLGYILLAEFSMVVFFTTWRLRHPAVTSWRDLADFTLLLALLAMSFVLVVNLRSGVGLLEGILPPAATIGIGFRLEALLAGRIARTAELEQRYRAAIDAYELYTAHPQQHPNYMPLLRSEIWEYLTVRLRSNAEFAEAPAPFRIMAVERELQRESWAAMPASAAPLVSPPQSSLSDLLSLPTTPAVGSPAHAANGSKPANPEEQLAARIVT